MKFLLIVFLVFEYGFVVVIDCEVDLWYDKLFRIKENEFIYFNFL